ncbi:MAG: hypothetical protein MRK01_09380 [Candidatus Scalindua sp.]|nr:hypothetical protein [Candidatus Scalindua sp.]
MIKMLHVAGTLVLFQFCFSGSSVSAASILEGLNSFQESLAGWVEKVEKLEERSSTVEKDLEAKDKQLAEINRSLSNIESLLSKLDSKLTRVQNMRSVEGVKETLKSYEDVLDVIKKRFSEMVKRLEDQEVKVSVLERVYEATQNPVETMLREMDKQKVIISALTEKMATQDKSLLVIMDDFKKGTSSSEDLGKKIEKLNKRLAELESGAVIVKGGSVAQKGHGTEKKEGSQATGSKDQVAADHKTESHDTGEHKQESDEMKGYIDIGMGFFINDLKFVSFGSSCRVQGEIVNKSKRYYSTADFIIKVFDKVGKQLGGQGFSLIGLSQNHKADFEEILTGVNEEEITSYTLYYAKMPSLLATGEGGLKMLERKHEGVTAEEAAGSLHDEKKEEAEVIEVAKDFKEIGNGFYIGNVTFSGFGSSSSVAGLIQNHSETDIGRAAFRMQIFSKEYGLITKLDFAVRHLKAGESQHFEEIITGVRPTDIDRYEVLFKDSY